MLLVGVALSLVSFFLLRSWERDRAQGEFRERAAVRAAALGRAADRGIEVVASIRGLFDASIEVERHEFAAFTRSALAAHPEIEALEWIPRVPQKQISAYVAAARADGHDAFQITEQDPSGLLVPASNRPEYFPVFFVEPLKRNEVALGFDLGSDALRRRALEEARDTGKPTATAPVRIVQETEGQLSFLVFVPVYEKLKPLDSVEQRRWHLQGFAIGVFRVNELVEASFQGQRPGPMSLRFYDTTDRDNELLMYAFEPDSGPMSGLVTGEGRANPRSGSQWETVLAVGERRWALVFEPIGGSNGWVPWLPWAVLAAGFALIGVAGTYGYGLVSRTAQVEQLVVQRTEALEASNRKLRESESSTRAVLMSMTEGLAVFTQDGRVLWWNDAVAMLTGLPEREAVGRHIDDVMRMKAPDLENSEALSVLRGTLLEGVEAKDPLYITILRPERRELSVRVFHIDLGSGHVLPGVVIRDITGEREMDRRKDAFVSVASHELRTPMTAILGFTELLLKREVAPERRQAWLQEVYQESRRLTTIVDDLLNVSRIHSGKLQLRREQVSVAHVVEAVVGTFKPTTDQHQFIAAVSGDVPAVWADRDKVGQVLMNLLGNAIKYSPQGGKVSVAARHDPERRRVVVSVADEGIGIAPDDQQDLFTSFHRIRPPETDGIRGTGLGLYIVKALVELMQGEVWVESEPGKGSTFYFTLPTDYDEFGGGG
ncbi:MAG: CHASE domain-containing protein [Chloroflexi bacterium]|nr:CHASE domain-containing protein [Chloroflexota bacterium]